MSKLVSRREGFHLACELGFKFINLDIDRSCYKLANVIWCYGTKYDFSNFIYLLQETLLNQEWIVHPHHIFHNANGVADELAKKGREQ